MGRDFLSNALKLAWERDPRGFLQKHLLEVLLDFFSWWVLLFLSGGARIFLQLLGELLNGGVGVVLLLGLGLLVFLAQALLHCFRGLLLLFQAKERPELFYPLLLVVVPAWIPLIGFALAGGLLVLALNVSAVGSLSLLAWVGIGTSLVILLGNFFGGVLFLREAGLPLSGAVIGAPLFLSSLGLPGGVSLLPFGWLLNQKNVES